MFPQFAAQLESIGAVQLGVIGTWGFQAQPDRRDADFRQFLIGILGDRIGGRENVERPALAGGLHQRQQFHDPALLQQEIFVHDEEAVLAARLLRVFHQAEQLRARFVKVEDLPLAAEKGGGRTEIAAHGTAHRRNNGRRGGIGGGRNLDAQHTQVERRGEIGVPDRRVHLFAQVLPHPGDAVALHDVVGIQHLLHAGNGRNVTAHDDRRARREFPHHPAHLPRLAHVHDDRRDADNVVVVCGEFLCEGLACREIQHRAGRVDVPLDHQDAPGTMETAQRERALPARDLIMIELHRIDGAASVSVILRIRAEDGGKEDSGLASFWMRLNHDGKEIDKRISLTFTVTGFDVHEG